MTIAAKKSRTAFFCSQCGAQHQRWQGQCKECNAWNTLVEERIVTTKRGTQTAPQSVIPLPKIVPSERSGYLSGIGEFDRVLGGSLLTGMAVLLSGDPGIGKSTLLLQAAAAYASQGATVLYVSGEESAQQIRLRAERLGLADAAIDIATTTALEEILALMQEKSYQIALVDSIQTVTSSQFDSPPGTVGQVRESANQLVQAAKKTGVALVLVGHVTKDGMVAGPKLLEHLVDTVISFEGDRSFLYRLLRASKNRFGSVDEIGLFQMTSQGLAEVANPSAYFLADHSRARTGAVVTSICEGNRPLLLETQALVTPASFGTPQRVAGGIDSKRLALLLAILEKRCDYPVGSHDVFVSIAGGLKVSDPAVDLPIMLAIVSSLLNKTLDPKLLVFGEVGLSGEMRAVSMTDRRLAEAARLGFTTAIIPAVLEQSPVAGIRLVQAADIQQAVELAIN